MGGLNEEFLVMQFVRSVYVDGIMFGEAMEALQRGEVEARDFVLV